MNFTLKMYTLVLYTTTSLEQAIKKLAPMIISARFKVDDEMIN
jgi:hypothetical protein